MQFVAGVYLLRPFHMFFDNNAVCKLCHVTTLVLEAMKLCVHETMYTKPW